MVVCLNPIPNDKNLDWSKLKAFSPFSTMLSKALFFRVFKSPDYVVNG